MSHDNTTPLAIKAFCEIGKPIHDKNRIVLHLDHAYPAPNILAAENHKKIIEFVKEQELPHFHRQGVCHQVMLEEGYVTPGAIIIGADCIHTTVNGMGERTGIPDLAETVVAFHNLEGETKYNLEPLVKLSGYLEKATGFFMAANKPITGQNAFSHKSGVHTNGVLKDPRTYEPFDPAVIGRERKIVIDKYTGKTAVAARLDEYGIEVSGAELEVIVTRIKNIGDQRKQLFDADILEIAEQVTGREIDVIPHDINALIMLEVESHVYTTSVVRRLRSFENVSSIYEVTGDYDISAFANAENMAALNNLIEEIRTVQGVKRTETRMVLKKYNGNNQ
jgi:DNA-binding Lrp family transcriptional regulator